MGKKEVGLPRSARNDGLPVVAVTVGGVEVAGVVGERPDDSPVGEPMPLPEPDGGWPADEFTGVGGSFVRDPFTGVRSRVG